MKKGVVAFLIIMWGVLLSLAQAAPIPYNWDTNYCAYFTAHSGISAWDATQTTYVINKYENDYADTNTSQWSHHDPPASTSLSETHTESFGIVTKEWKGRIDSTSKIGKDSIHVSGEVSTNQYVNASDYTSANGYGKQYGYFKIDSDNQFLKVDAYFIVNGSDFYSLNYKNYAWGGIYWYLRDYGTGNTPGSSYTEVAYADIDWTFYDINVGQSHESHWDPIPLQKDHWYYIDAYAGETLTAYQGDWVKGDIQLSLQIVSTPVPATGILLLSGVLGLIGIRKK